MSLRNRTIQSGVWSVVRSWGSQFLGTVFFLILAYLLAPADFGVVAFAGAIIALGEIVLDLGLTKALIQESEVNSRLTSSVFWLLLGVGLGLMLLFWGLAPVVEMFFDHGSIDSVVKLMAVSFLLVNCGTVFRAHLERQLQFDRMALSSLSATVTAGVVGVLLAWSGFGFWSLVVREVLYDAVESSGYILLSDWSPELRWSMSEIGNIMSFGGGIIGIRSAGFFRRQTDDFLIGTLLGATALGYYSVAYRIYLALSRLLLEAVNRVTFPSFSKLQEDIPKLRGAYTSALRMACFFVLPMFLMVSLFSKPIISILMDPKWLPASILLTLFSLGGVLETLTMGSGQVVLSLGRSGLKSLMGWANALLNVLAFLIGIKWGIVGVACAYVVSQFIYQVIPVLVLNNLIDLQFDEYVRQVIQSLLLASVSAGMACIVDIWIVPGIDVIRLILGGGMMTLVYLLLSTLFQRSLVLEAWSVVEKAWSELISPIK